MIFSDFRTGSALLTGLEGARDSFLRDGNNRPNAEDILIILTNDNPLGSLTPIRTVAEGLQSGGVHIHIGYGSEIERRGGASVDTLSLFVSKYGSREELLSIETYDQYTDNNNLRNFQTLLVRAGYPIASASVADFSEYFYLFMFREDVCSAY